MLGEIGTLEWTRRTNGLLSRPERARYVAATVRELALRGPLLAAYRLGWTVSRPAPIDDDSLRIPDSAIAHDAVRACEEVQSRSIIEHNYRSFIFARALGALARVEHDPEVLFVAAMFHDQGAMEPDLTDGGRCFTLRGANEAEAHLAASGRPAERCAAAAEAITLHINPVVPLEQGPEAHLMHDGVILDTVGRRAWELRRDAVDRVRARHPRLRFSQEAGRLLGEEARAIPRCRTAAAFGAGLGLALRLGPWRD